MTISDFLTRLHARGIGVTVKSDEIVNVRPKGSLNDDERHFVLVHKPDLIAALRARDVLTYAEMLLVHDIRVLIQKAAELGCELFLDNGEVEIRRGERISDNLLRALVQRYEELRDALQER